MEALKTFHEKDWRVISVTQRGSDDLELTTPTLYSGATFNDIGAVLHWAACKWPAAKIHLIGKPNIRYSVLRHILSTKLQALPWALL